MNFTELHLHLDGSMRLQTLEDLADDAGVTLPDDICFFRKVKISLILSSGLLKVIISFLFFGFSISLDTSISPYTANIRVLGIGVADMISRCGLGPLPRIEARCMTPTHEIDRSGHGMVERYVATGEEAIEPEVLEVGQYFFKILQVILGRKNVGASHYLGKNKEVGHAVRIFFHKVL